MLKLSDKVTANFYHPKNVGELDLTNKSVIMAEIATPDGYTHLQIFIQLKNTLITDAKFKALGCPVAIACMSFTTDYLIGKNLEACALITVEFLVKALDLPKEKYSVAGLMEDLFKQILIMQ